jgi:hypothetical protein
MSTEGLKRILESRILSTLKLNPYMTYNDALEAVLRSIGVCISFDSKELNTNVRSVENANF